MSNFLDGSVMRLQVEGKNVFHEVEVSIEGSTDFKEIATKDTDGKEVSPGSQSFSLSCSAKGSPDTTTENTDVILLGYWKNKTKVAFTLTDGIVGHVTYSGEAYLENFNMGSPNDEIVDFSYSLKGTGELVIGVVPE